jgi:type II secretory pathway pseudopilin PulG
VVSGPVTDAQRTGEVREYRCRPMPSAKEVRARQNRQRERIVAAQAARRRTQKRRRQAGAGAIVILLVLAVVLSLTFGLSTGSNNKVADAPTTPTAPTTTVAPLASVKGKPCVGLKDPLPKGSPAFLIAPGPAPTKLTSQDLKIGTGAVVPKNGKVTVNYTGVACSDGKIFDSSYTTGKPFAADLSATGQLIAGWQQGIPGMKIGGVRLLGIPASLAYGSGGRAPIAPDEALYFLIAAVKLG